MNIELKHPEIPYESADAKDWAYKFCIVTGLKDTETALRWFNAALAVNNDYDLGYLTGYDEGYTDGYERVFETR